MWLEPTESCTAASTAKYLLGCCKTLGGAEVWVSDTASMGLFKYPTRSQLLDESFCSLGLKHSTRRSSFQSGPKATIIARSPNRLLYLIYACNNWILKPPIANVNLTSHSRCPTLNHLKAPLLPKSRPNELDNEK